MSDDLLTRATAALRDETEDSEAGARFTRARVLASLNETRVKRRTRVTFLVPLAACFAAATAWGTSGDNASRVIEFVTQAFRSEPAPAPRATPVTTSKRDVATAAPAVAPSVTAPAEPSVEAPPAVIEPAPEAPPVAVAPTSRPVTRTVVPSAARPERAADPAHDLYRAAHRAHFVEHDSVAALGAWDAYLRAAPSGRFSLEARYNRALCLVRLSRNDEARAALAPFAAGSYGEYRQAEARALLDGLGSSR